MSEDLAEMKGNPISVGRAINFAWSVFKERSGLFAAIVLTLCGAWVALEVVVIAGQQFGIVLWWVAHLAFLVLFAGIEAGVLKICLALYDGDAPTWADTFAHLALGPMFLAGQMLYLLMVVAGLLLLVVPGLYLGVRYALFGFGLVTGESDLMHSFRHSAILSAGAGKSLFAIMVSLLALNALGAGLLGLGLFVTLPLSVLMMTAVYRQLSAH